MFAQFTRIMRWCLLLLLCIPVLAGLVGVIFPALGYFPAIGANSFSLDVFRTLFALDDIWHMVWLSLFTGVGSTLLAMAGAFLLLATFSDHGPKKCSGLEIRQYDELQLIDRFNEHFSMIDHQRQLHPTPSGLEQEFLFALFRRMA